MSSPIKSDYVSSAPGGLGTGAPLGTSGAAKAKRAPKPDITVTLDRSMQSVPVTASENAWTLCLAPPQLEGSAGQAQASIETSLAQLQASTAALPAGDSSASPSSGDAIPAALALASPGNMFAVIGFLMTKELMSSVTSDAGLLKKGSELQSQMIQQQAQTQDQEFAKQAEQRKAATRHGLIGLIMDLVSFVVDAVTGIAESMVGDPQGLASLACAALDLTQAGLQVAEMTTHSSSEQARLEKVSSDIGIAQTILAVAAGLAGASTVLKAGKVASSAGEALGTTLRETAGAAGEAGEEAAAGATDAAKVAQMSPEQVSQAADKVAGAVQDQANQLSRTIMRDTFSSDSLKSLVKQVLERAMKDGGGMLDDAAIDSASSDLRQTITKTAANERAGRVGLLRVGSHVANVASETANGAFGIRTARLSNEISEIMLQGRSISGSLNMASQFQGMVLNQFQSENQALEQNIQRISNFISTDADTLAGTVHNLA